MLYGEATGYTMIGGTNMDAGIMPMLEGSSGDISGTGPATMTISWDYPGGISAKTAGETQSWGYFIKAQSAGGTIVSSEDVKQWLINEHSISEDEADFGTTSESVRTIINNQMAEYAARLMELAMFGGDAGQKEVDAFVAGFSGCAVVHRS